MTKFKVGDRVRLIKKDPDFDTVAVGTNGTVIDVESETYEGNLPIMVNFGDGKEGWPWIQSVELVETQKQELGDIIYLSGTPGQLEGFRQDWVKAGHLSTDSAISWPATKYIEAGHHHLSVEFSNKHLPRIMTASKANPSIPVLENWQAVLDKAATYKNTKAPIQLAGYDVELKGEQLHIGCRRISKKTAMNAMERLAVLKELLGSEGKAVTIPELLQIREWLLTK